MGKRSELEKKIKKLRLEKRDLVLLGKNTDIIDKIIKDVEIELKELLDNRPK